MSDRPNVILKAGAAFVIVAALSGLAACAGSDMEGAGAAGEMASDEMPTYPDQRLVMPVNDLPNPYERVHPWGELPTGPYDPGDYDARASFIGFGEGPDGNYYALTRCIRNSCTGSDNPPLVSFDRDGNLLSTWGSGLFDFPHGFYVDPEGYVWATDQRNHQAFKFSLEGELLLTIGMRDMQGDPPDHLSQPTAVVVAPNGDIFVAEGHSNDDPSVSNRVSKWAPDGTFIMSFGSYGTAPGEFRTPHALAFDSQGRLFVGDRHNNRIQIFDQEGNFIDLWYQFGRPSGIAISPDDRIYVADSESYDFHNPGWKKGIRIGSATDGSVDYFIEDIESTTISHSGAEGVGIDSDGNVFGATVRRRMLEKYIPQM